MKKNILYCSFTAVLIFFCNAYSAPLDLIVAPEETKTMAPGMYEYRNITLGERSTLILGGGTTLACENLSAAEGASIEHSPQIPGVQSNLVLLTHNAKGVDFLHINANGKDAEHKTGVGPTGPDGRDGENKVITIHSARKGQSGRPGQPGDNGCHAANVKLYLPNLTPGSLIRVHANGGNGGNGQKGGTGGQGGDGDVGTPAKDGGSGGRGGKGGNGGDAGKIIVYLVLNDEATEEDKKASMNTVRFESANSGGNHGNGGAGGNGGRGGKGHSLGGDGRSGSTGSMGGKGDDGKPGRDSKESPKERWVVFDVLTLTEYAKEYHRTQQQIRTNMAN